MTAEEVLSKYTKNYYSRNVYVGDCNIKSSEALSAMIEFAKYHVKEALKKASEEASMIDKDWLGESDESEWTRKELTVNNKNGRDNEYSIYKPSILNAYPETNII